MDDITLEHKTINFFNRRVWATREIYIVTTNKLLQNPQHDNENTKSLDDDENKVETPVTTESPASSASKKRKIDTITHQYDQVDHESTNLTILHRVYVVHHFMCLGSPVWMKMFTETWKESSLKENEVINMYVDDELEAITLYSLIESSHTLELPISILDSEEKFIMFVILADKYELTKILEMVINKLPDAFTNERVEFNLMLNLALIERFRESYSPMLQTITQTSIFNAYNIMQHHSTMFGTFKDRQKFIGGLVSMFSPLDKYVDDQRLMRLNKTEFIDMMSDDRLLAINESTVCWCCINYMVSQKQWDSDIFSCVRLELLSPFALVYFSYDFKSGYNTITKQVNTLAGKVLFRSILPKWTHEYEDDHIKKRLQLTTKELESLYTMDYIFHIDPSSLTLTSFDENTMHFTELPEQIRGGWKWLLMIDRLAVGDKNKASEEVGFVSISTKIKPINSSKINTTTSFQASYTVSFILPDHSCNLIHSHTNGRVDSEWLEHIINMIPGHIFKWNDLTSFLHTDNTIRVRLKIDPSSLSY